MSDRLKKCPFCAEEVLDAAIKCKHCGSDMRSGTGGEAPGNRAQAGATQAVASSTTLPFLFRSGPGYWKAKPSYWIFWVIGLATIPVFGLGFGVWAFLFIGSLISKADWRKDELKRSIEAAQA